ncbi:unnamed protein product [Mytilus edulis]|uniref:Uncharacterized protein n=1 Tax=Mytilus edulis TaxID=6550 RepID=A0A8S3QUY5_MYTED|nr:unnamed protein product [Mytilus edulis]
MIASIIDTAGDDFLNTMFVLTVDDIRENAENNYESFGFIIPEDLLEKYIEKWINSVKTADSVKECMDVNRPLMNAKFCSAVRNYMRQLDKEKIAFIIDTTEDDFLNTMFVMKEEDINDNSRNTFECFGIVITDDLIQKYIKSWLGKVSCANSVKEYMNANRPSMDVSFRSVFRTYLRQLEKEEIGNFILRGDVDFVNKMFVMTEEDIQENAENKYEYFGIVIT